MGLDVTKLPAAINDGLERLSTMSLGETPALAAAR